VAQEDHTLSAEVLQQVIAALSKAEPTSRSKILQTAATFFDIRPTVISNPLSSPQQSKSSGVFSEDRSILPKDFIHDKAPRTDIERVTCLAYYLTHYRATPHFKTLDISKLNTEAAQVKFSNAAWSVENAAKKGLLVPAPQGHKQISSFGERFVLALPNRDAAKEVLANTRKKRRAKRADDSNNTEISTEESAEDSLA
jgi:hypothetical protein